MEQNTNGGMDFMSTPIETLWKEDIEWLDNRIFMLEAEGRLCGGTGEEIIAEFGFRGNYDTVLTKLKEFTEKIKSKPYKEIERFDVLKRSEKYVEYRKSNKDVYIDKMKDSIKKYTMEGLTEALEISNAKYKMNEVLHEKKECICFIN